jgi:hypothetical protein
MKYENLEFGVACLADGSEIIRAGGFQKRLELVVRIITHSFRKH